MTTQGSAADVRPAADVTVVVPEKETAAAETAIDWKVRYESAEGARAKLENDLRAQKGLMKRQDERDSHILERMDLFDRQQAVLIKALGDGTTNELPAEVDRIQAEGRRAQASRSWSTVYGSVWEDLQEAVQDSDGNYVLDLKTAPELEEVRRNWVNAFDGVDKGTMTPAEALPMLAKAAAQANLATKKALRSRDQAEMKKTREAAAAAAKKLEDADLLDLDTGPAAGGGSNISDEAFLARYSAGDASTPADHARAAKYLRNL